jgi:hypothetical protein
MYTATTVNAALDRLRICGQFVIRTDADILQFGRESGTQVSDLVGVRAAGVATRTIILACDGWIYWPAGSQLSALQVGSWDGEFRVSVV